MTMKNCRKDPISKYTLLKYMDQLGYECEGVLTSLLLDRIGIAFDGRDNGLSTNLLGIYVNCYDPKKECVQMFLQ